MAEQLPPELIEALSPEVRLALAEVFANFSQACHLMHDLTELVGALNALDDQRAAEMAELRLTVRLLAQLQGIETKGAPLVDLIAEWSKRPEAVPVSSWPQADQERYWSEIRQLREQREAEAGSEEASV